MPLKYLIDECTCLVTSNPPCTACEDSVLCVGCGEPCVAANDETKCYQCVRETLEAVEPTGVKH